MMRWQIPRLEWWEVACYVVSFAGMVWIYWIVSR